MRLYCPSALSSRESGARSSSSTEVSGTEEARPGHLDPTNSGLPYAAVPHLQLAIDVLFWRELALLAGSGGPEVDHQRNRYSHHLQPEQTETSDVVKHAANPLNRPARLWMASSPAPVFRFGWQLGGCIGVLCFP